MTGLGARWLLGFLVLSGVTCAASTSPAVASQVRPVNLEEMTERAASIFSGRCTGVRAEIDARLGVRVTVATFQVLRSAKGQQQQQREVTLRMVGDGGGSWGTAVPGPLPFREGEEVVLFLYGESRLGLTSTVGFGQGRFSIVETKPGSRAAVNAFGNRRLFERLSDEAGNRLRGRIPLARGRHEVEPDILLDMVELLQGRPPGAGRSTGRGQGGARP